MIDRFSRKDIWKARLIPSPSCSNSKRRGIGPWFFAPEFEEKGDQGGIYSLPNSKRRESDRGSLLPNSKRRGDQGGDRGFRVARKERYFFEAEHLGENKRESCAHRSRASLPLVFSQSWERSGLLSQKVDGLTTDNSERACLGKPQIGFFAPRS